MEALNFFFRHVVHIRWPQLSLANLDDENSSMHSRQVFLQKGEKKGSISSTFIFAAIGYDPAKW
jgi:hypothetical protein